MSETSNTATKLAAALIAALVLGGCGSGEDRQAAPPAKLGRELATSLAARSDAVAQALAGGDSCKAASLAHDLQRQTIAAINQGHVAVTLQEPLLGAVTDLTARIDCVPPARQPEHDRGKHQGKHGKKHKEGD
jgi:hypothetical protein